MKHLAKGSALYHLASRLCALLILLLTITPPCMNCRRLLPSLTPSGLIQNTPSQSSPASG